MTFRYKANQKHHDGHVDDWLMTYADMITLLLCFFAIFLSVSVPRQDKFDQAKQQVQKTFAAPDLLAGKFPVEKNAASGGIPNKALDNLPSIVGTHPDSHKYDTPPQPPPRPGDRITTVDMSSATFFPVGSATLSDDGKAALIKVLASLNTTQYKDFVITVEGHTDDSPISTPQFPSNWELSTARAAAVVRFFIEQNIPPQKLRAAGYADVSPKVPNRDAAGNPIPENQAQNRRVVIKLEKIDKQPDTPQ